MKQMIVTVLAVLITLSGTQLNAQKNRVVETSISGTVYDAATGKPLDGVQVVIPDVVSVITDEQGNFTLTKMIEGASLVVSLPGYSTRQIALFGRKQLKIALTDESFRSSYQEVALPMGSTNALANPYAVSAHENIEDYKLSVPTIDNVFQSYLSGLNAVSRSGMPGSGANLYVNGFNSLNASNQPLIVVDGVIYENPVYYSLVSGNHVSPLSDFDSKDIDKITVLKDGTSIYGSKGANGVIVINTLRAKSPATRINAYAYAGVNMEPGSEYRMMNDFSYRNYLNDMLLSKGMSSNEIQALPYMNSEKPVQENWGVTGNPDYYRYNQHTDWQDEVFKTSINQNFHLNVTGGNDFILYAIGVGYLKHGGSVDNTDFNRYSFRTNASIKMTEWFKMNANVSYINSNRTLGFEGMNRNFSPVYSALVKAPFTSPYVYNVLGDETPNLEKADIFDVSNPVALINNAVSTNNRSRFSGIMNGEFTVNKYLSANVIVGLTSDRIIREQVFMPQAGIFHTSLPISDVTNESMQLRNILRQMNMDARVSYERNFDRIHDLKVRAGFRYLDSSNELDWGHAFNTSSDEMRTLGDGLNDLAQIGGSLGNWKSVSNYLNAEYGYMNRYFVGLNASLDASSRFGADAAGLKLMNQVFGFFPSLNAAWLISSEEFMAGQSFFDQLKLRAGYAITGNDDIGNYSARHYYLPQSLLGAYGLVRGNIPNTKLKWETNKKATVGVDAAFADERLQVSLDLYTATTSDLIVIRPNESYTGISSAVSNDGSMRNQGIDLMVNARLVDNGSFNWDLGLNLSHNQVKLLSMTDDVTYTTIAGATIRSKVGEAPAQFWGYQTDGILNSVQEANGAGLKMQRPDGTIIPFVAGDMRFVDKNNDKVINEADMTVIGDASPLVTGALNSTLRWNNFSLSGVFSFAYGNDVFNAVRAGLESMSGTDNQTVVAANRWRYDGQDTSIPAAVWGDPHGNSRFSDRWIEDGSYLRLKTVSLSYDIPVKSSFITGAQVYATGHNLLTFTNYLGYDPEFSTGQSVFYYGIDRGVTPQPRAILLGVKIGL
ncbi:MAG: SusC/RagA family TonB-linked outer membrane protein [Paludibacter sp.]|nr:SusC/RagA family TonB-linked outer membrane protein [Paludibacter sp.]